MATSIPIYRFILSSNKQRLLIDIISALFILLFVYTAISKLYNIKGFESVLERSPVVGKNANIVALAVPIVELILSGLLFLKSTKRIALYLSTGLMLTFTLYVAYLMFFLPFLPCSCGGAISIMSWKQHLIFNSGFTLLGVFGIILEKRDLKTSKLV